MARTPRETEEPKPLSFERLRDHGNRVAEAYGLAFTLPDDLREIYVKFGIDLAKGNGDGTWRLPMPARFVMLSFPDRTDPLLPRPFSISDAWLDGDRPVLEPWATEGLDHWVGHVRVHGHAGDEPALESVRAGDVVVMDLVLRLGCGGVRPHVVDDRHWSTTASER